MRMQRPGKWRKEQKCSKGEFEAWTHISDLDAQSRRRKSQQADGASDRKKEIMSRN